MVVVPNKQRVTAEQTSSLGSHVGGFMVVGDGELGGGTEVVSRNETGFVSDVGAGVVVGGLKVIVSVCGTGVVVSGGGTGVISGLDSNSSHKQSLPHKQSFSPMYDCTKNTPKLSKYTR